MVCDAGDDSESGSEPRPAGGDRPSWQERVWHMTWKDHVIIGAVGAAIIVAALVAVVAVTVLVG